MPAQPRACNLGTFVAEMLEQRICLSASGEFVDVIDNAYLPLIPGSTYIYRGDDAQGRAVRSRLTVTGETKLITGVTTTVVRDRQYLEGELIQDTREFFAQDDGGNVWRFGAQVRRIESGVVVSTEGSWEAGENGAAAAIIMKAQPRAGDAYLQEVAPGGAITRANVLSLNEFARVPFASFGDALKTEESSALDSNATQNKFYAPGIGCVMSQAANGQTLRLAYVNLAADAFSDTIDNPYYPLTPGTTLIYRGVDNGVPIRLRVNVTHETRRIAGIDTTVVRDRQYEDGELVQDTTSYYAQDKAGNVWLFGETTRTLEDGVLVGTEGSWEAGVNVAAPTLFMRARPSVGDLYRVGVIPGISEDEARVLGRHDTVTVPFGTFNDVLVMEDSSEMEPDDVEIKIYVPGIGPALEYSAGDGDEVLRLAYVLVEQPN